MRTAIKSPQSSFDEKLVWWTIADEKPMTVNTSLSTSVCWLSRNVLLSGFCRQLPNSWENWKGRNWNHQPMVLVLTTQCPQSPEYTEVNSGCQHFPLQTSKTNKINSPYYLNPGLFNMPLWTNHNPSTNTAQQIVSCQHWPWLMEYLQKPTFSWYSLLDGCSFPASDLSFRYWFNAYQICWMSFASWNYSNKLQQLRWKWTGKPGEPVGQIGSIQAKYYPKSSIMSGGLGWRPKVLICLLEIVALWSAVLNLPPPPTTLIDRSHTSTTSIGRWLNMKLSRHGLNKL